MLRNEDLNRVLSKLVIQDALGTGSIKANLREQSFETMFTLSQQPENWVQSAGITEYSSRHFKTTSELMNAFNECYLLDPNATQRYNNILLLSVQRNSKDMYPKSYIICQDVDDDYIARIEDILGIKLLQIAPNVYRMRYNEQAY